MSAIFSALALPLKKYAVVIAVGVAITAFAWGSVTGWKLSRYACQKEKTAALENLIKQHERIRRQNQEIESQYFLEREEKRIEYQTIYKRVVEYIETSPDLSNCSLDAYGVQIWNAANKGGTPTEPVATVFRPASGGVGEPGSAATEPRRSNRTVPRVQEQQSRPY